MHGEACEHMESGTKLAMTRTRIDDGDEGVADPNQIWVRARMMAMDLGLGAVHERERRKPGRQQRRREMGEARGGSWSR